YSDCRPISCASQTLLVRFCNSLHRMPLHSVWNNSGRLYDRCAFTRISAGIVLHRNCTSAWLKLCFTSFPKSSWPRRVNVQSRLSPRSEPLVAVVRHWLSARSTHRARSHHRELPPSDRQYGFPCSLAPRPCVSLFSGLRLLVRLELASDQNSTASFGP